MAFHGATIYELSEKGIEKAAYEKTDHFLITRDFLNHRDAYLKELFQES
jgi:predicted ATPase